MHPELVVLFNCASLFASETVLRLIEITRIRIYWPTIAHSGGVLDGGSRVIMINSMLGLQEEMQRLKEIAQNALLKLALAPCKDYRRCESLSRF